MNREAQGIFCGPAGWPHPRWERFTSAGASSRQRHSLEFLSQYCDAVEITTSFHEALKPEIAAVWLKKVSENPRFQFTAKLHRRFTHERSLDLMEVQAFKDGLWPLLGAKRLGCLLMQFPWSFRFTPENRAYLIRLRRLFHEFPLVAEMRHASWMLDEAIGTFIDFHLGFCNIDQPRYTNAMPPTTFLTSPIGYVRLHGKNCFGWFGENAHSQCRYDYLYSEQEMREWAIRIQRICGYSAKTFVICNNDAGPKALVNALQLRSLLDGFACKVPDAFLQNYPQQLAVCRVGGQHALFTEYSAKAVA